MTSIMCLSVILLLFAVQFSVQQQIACDYKDNCDTTAASLAIIRCDKTFGSDGTDPCTCESGSACPDLAGKNYGNVDEDFCFTTCQATDECSFWKYTNIQKTATKQTSCYLMKKEECPNLATDIECPSNHGDGSVQCKSDVVNEDSCDPETTPTPSPGKNCPGPITPKDEKDGKNYIQKWQCFNPDPDADSFVVDMYSEEATTMPLDGWCTLVIDEDGGSCKKTEPEFKFTCKVDGEKGAWTKEEGITDGTDGTDVIVNDKLTDVECTATNLNFENPDLAVQAGRTIVCSKGGVTVDPNNAGQFFIPAENYCHMFCDGYDILTFYTDFIADPAPEAEKRGWFYMVTGGTPEPLEKADILDCWGKRF